MAVRIHPHAAARMSERGATPEEVHATVEGGAQFQARFGRTGFHRNFPFGRQWRGRTYGTNQVETGAKKRRARLKQEVVRLQLQCGDAVEPGNCRHVAVQMRSAVAVDLHHGAEGARARRAHRLDDEIAQGDRVRD